MNASVFTHFIALWWFLPKKIGLTCFFVCAANEWTLLPHKIQLNKNVQFEIRVTVQKGTPSNQIVLVNAVVIETYTYNMLQVFEFMVFIAVDNKRWIIVYGIIWERIEQEFKTNKKKHTHTAPHHTTTLQNKTRRGCF